MNGNNPKPLISCRGVTKVYGSGNAEVHALRGVDLDVYPGEITMLVHLKISEGGGNLAPRVYFYDDTNGPTKKVHVGLVGPHYLVPNKSTN